MRLQQRRQALARRVRRQARRMRRPIPARRRARRLMPATWPHATRLFEAKGFQTLFEVKGGLNSVHHCCADSVDRSATAQVASRRQVALDDVVGFCYCLVARRCGEKPDGTNAQEPNVAFVFLVGCCYRAFVRHFGEKPDGALRRKARVCNSILRNC